MTMLREEATAPDAEALIPEARALRRHRWTRATALVVAVALVASVVTFAVGKGRLWDRGPQVAATPNGQLLPTPGHVTSLVLTRTVEIDGVQTQRVKIASTLGSGPQTTETWQYRQQFPYPTAQLSEIIANGVTYNRLSGPSRVCYSNVSGCVNTTASWMTSEFELVSKTRRLPAVTGLDPSYLFPQLRKLVIGLKADGLATVVGVPTTLYRGALPAQKPTIYRGPFPIPVRSAASQSLEMVLGLAVLPGSTTSYFNGAPTATLTPTFRSAPIELWVDAKGVVRQVRVETPTVVNSSIVSGPRPPVTKPRIAQMFTTLTYADFNQPVTLSVPAAKDVFVPKKGGYGIRITGQGRAAPIALVDQAEGYTAKIDLSAHVSGVPTHNQFSVALSLTGSGGVDAALPTPNACEILGTGDGPFSLTCAAVPGTYAMNLTNAYSTKLDQSGAVVTLAPAICSGAPKTVTLGTERSYKLTLDCVVG